RGGSAADSALGSRRNHPRRVRRDDSEGCPGGRLHCACRFMGPDAALSSAFGLVWHFRSRGILAPGRRVIRQIVREERRYVASLAAAIVAGVAIRVWLAFAAEGKSWTDSAIIALMAMHALRGRFYAFYWGQSY